MTMADHVVVMRDGVIEQQGAPLDLYDHPINRFVAGFIGSPAMNFVPATVAADGRSLVLDFTVEKQTLAIAGRLQPGQPVLAGLRPEHLVTTAEGQGSFDVRIDTVESTGSSTFLTTATVPSLTIVETSRRGVRNGDRLGISIDPAQVHVFDVASELRIDAHP
jgi:multiple sugar transport system ATP-binding protein